ncbi:Dipeptide-binding ABC transporter, periplasmic substrate-binding component [Enhygromyxa salina]|uniref:Dipeptide-binding ABC transporter, periplasmic substrate-binding component n=1 Tax=Enhygromyxa salina TaxID=215803 RepID=A0A0C1ZUP9_9BACT|nr:IgGFc-binding protein [Enhygromyxa salina]KIG14768.1 Dipeptide-binding ABC transporter, periplasmic substrate-binding component [Enhygromyxa salina]
MNTHNNRFCTLAWFCALALAGCSDDPLTLDDPEFEEQGDSFESTGHPDEEAPAIVCQPSQRRCDDARTLGVCAATGLEWQPAPCGAHQLCDDCVGDACEAACVGPCEDLGSSPSSAGCSFYAMATDRTDTLLVTNPDTDRSATVELRAVARGTHDEAASSNPVVLDPGESHTFILPATEDVSELWVSPSRRQSGGIWHVVADLPLVARLHHWGKDGSVGAASLLLPEHMMTGDHVIYGYPPHPQAGDVAPNYFTVIALEHQTTVQWWPTAATAGDGLPLPFVMPGARGQQLLNRHDNIRVAASSKLAAAACQQDLSGTVIAADGPIWVESTVERASVPGCPSDGCEDDGDAGEWCDSNTLDIMIEQNLPIQFWGTDYVGPHAPLHGDEIHRWRVFAGADDVTITVHPDQLGAPIQLAKRGDWREITVPAGDHLRFSGDGPFMPVQYVAGAVEADEFGAPAMVQMVPTSQYLDRYVFAVGQASEPAVAEIHYVQITRASTGADVLLDGAVIGAGEWEAFGEWQIATLEVLAGTHVLDSVDPFGAVEYGYAAGDSNLRSGYACPVGMRSRDLSKP